MTHARPLAVYASLVLFGGVLAFLGIVIQGGFWEHAVFLASGLIFLVSAAVLRIRS